MEPLPQQTSPRYLELDILRFVAIMAVVVVHFTYTFPAITHTGPSYPAISPASRYGYLAVPLFFMISGFTVVKSARRKTVSQFLVARAVRLYPVFWLSCTLTFISLRLSHRMGDVPVKQYLFNMTMLQEFFGQASINGVYWTLTSELTFYFLITLLIAYQLWGRLLLVLVGWLSYVLLVGPSLGGNLFAQLLMPSYAPYFIAGVLFYLLHTRTTAPWKIYTALGVTFLLTLRSDRAQHLLLEQFYQGPPNSFNSYISGGIIAVFYLLFYLIIFRRLAVSPLPIWGWMGRLTYALYLTHTLGALPLRLLNGRVDKYLLLAGTIGAVLVIAWAVHILVEVPGKRLLTRISAPVPAYAHEPQILQPAMPLLQATPNF